MLTEGENRAWSRDEFYQEILKKRQSYHMEHPFDILMNEGKLTREQMQLWVANRYYYQISIPRKDAAIIANCPDREIRRHWVLRILDQDGTESGSGGIEAWLALGQGCGLSRQTMENLDLLLPGVRFAVDAYVNFARQAPWQEAVCSSLTELFATDAHQRRLETFPKYYPWIPEDSLRYFKARLSEARRDVSYGLEVTLNYFSTRALQERALEIIQFKMDVLWSMLDSIHLACTTGNMPRALAGR